MKIWKFEAASLIKVKTCTIAKNRIFFESIAPKIEKIDSAIIHILSLDVYVKEELKLKEKLTII